MTMSLGKGLIRNLCYLAWYGIELRPRLVLPRFMFPVLSVFRRRIAAPSFIVKELNRLPKGKLVDVGCGDGMFLDIAKQFGWGTLGIEMDPGAVRAARAAGHEVIEGTYEILAALGNQIDCVICSHVLEHVHEPKVLLRAISTALRSGGVALISLPNAGSVVRKAFSDSWRGLEAPRHLAIPRFDSLVAAATACGLEKESSFVSRYETLDASFDIARHRHIDLSELQRRLEEMPNNSGKLKESDSDFINVVFRKPDL